MAKVTHLGPAKPDSPVYKTGPVIGGKRFEGLKKPVFMKLTASMTREQMLENLLAALKKSGIKVNMDG
jgi:hypothetical protein